jgi:SAM-dependent methyltransferase
MAMQSAGSLTLSSTETASSNHLKAAARLRRLMLRTALRILRSVSLRVQRLAPPLDPTGADCKGFIPYRGHRLPPKSLRGSMCGDAFRTDSFYFLSAVHEATNFSARLGYTKNSRIVDIGCGLGRVATGLLAEFGDVQYFGVDANEGFVRWCKENIESLHPSFQFFHLNMANDLYNPTGTITGRDLRLPVDDASVDIVNLWGVFTNMLPEHVQAYIAEIARILRPQGRCFLTAFAEEDVEEVTINPAAYVPYACDSPLTCVRYRKQWLFSMFQQHGLQVEDFRYHGTMFPKQSEVYLIKRDNLV